MLVDPPLPAPPAEERDGKEKRERNRQSPPICNKKPSPVRSSARYGREGPMRRSRSDLRGWGLLHQPLPAPVEELFQIQKETYLGEEEGAEKEQQRRFL